MWAIETLSDPSFMGALLGALITGFVAICIMVITLKTENKRVDKRVLESFVKEATFFCESVKSLLDTAKGYAELQKKEENLITRVDEDGFPTEEIINIEYGKEVIEKDFINSLTAINTVERHYFTHKSIDSYIEIRSLITDGIEYYWERSMKHSANGVSDILFTNIGKTEMELKKLKRLIEVDKIIVPLANQRTTIDNSIALCHLLSSFCISKIKGGKNNGKCISNYFIGRYRYFIHGRCWRKR